MRASSDSSLISIPPCHHYRRTEPVCALEVELSAYLIVIDTEVSGPDVLSDFAERMTAATLEYGGKYLVRGGDIDVLGGDVSPQRVTVVEFGDADQARALLKSDVFAELSKVRNTAARGNTMIVEGV
ncbi:MAG: DUF1330 domain-containing protein [Chloroflexi bacterium]|nr:DUF1330 domain-containing protein [Chloroflexota bacterium]MYE32471.1 DUF1330 domain-containing protein [Chloroflexota bacterium]